MTSGISRSVALRSGLPGTRSPARARYQKPVSMSESGDWRCGWSSSDMGRMTADFCSLNEKHMLASARLCGCTKSITAEDTEFPRGRNTANDGVHWALSPVNRGPAEYVHRVFFRLVAGCV